MPELGEQERVDASTDFVVGVEANTMPELGSIMSLVTSGINGINQLRKSGGALVNFSHTGDNSLLKVHNEIRAQNINIHVGSQDIPAPGPGHSLSSVLTAGALERSGSGSRDAQTSAALLQAAPPRHTLPSSPQDERLATLTTTEDPTTDVSPIQIPFSMGLALVIDNKEWLQRDEPFTLDPQNLLVPVCAPDAIVEFRELNSNARKLAVLVRANQPIALCLGWSDVTDRPTAKVSQEMTGAYEWPLANVGEIKAGRSTWQLVQIPIGCPVDASTTTPTALIFRAEVASAVWMLQRTHPERGVQSYWLIVPRAG